MVHRPLYSSKVILSLRNKHLLNNNPKVEGTDLKSKLQVFIFFSCSPAFKQLEGKQKCNFLHPTYVITCIMMLSLIQ